MQALDVGLVNNFNFTLLALLEFLVIIFLRNRAVRVRKTKEDMQFD